MAINNHKAKNADYNENSSLQKIHIFTYRKMPTFL